VIRVLGMVIAIFCTATVLTGTIVLLYTWGQGNLTPEASQEIVAILKGEPRPVHDDEDEQKPAMSSYEQIVRERTERILSVSARESELAVLKQAIDDQTNFVLSERRILEQVKKQFREELDAEREAIISEATTQARGILLKMEPESAVEKLLTMSTDEAVLLLKGMPDKDAARILDQFRVRIAGKDPSPRIEKAEEIYKAIYQGRPLVDPVDSARQAISDPPDNGDAIR